MKKLCISLTALIVTTVTLFGQEGVVSVYGVPMGSSFEDAEKILDQRFTNKGHEGKRYLYYYDVPFGNIENTNLSLSFVEGLYGGTTMNTVTIGKRFQTQSEAINARESAKKFVAQKYPAITTEVLDGVKLYRFGLYKNNPEVTVGWIQVVEGQDWSTGEKFYILVITFSPVKRRPIDDI